MNELKVGTAHFLFDTAHSVRNYIFFYKFSPFRQRTTLQVYSVYV